MKQDKFKQSEIGMIPENWDITTLDNLSSVITDGSHFSPKETLHGMKIIATVKNMTYNGFDFQSCKRISDEDYNALVQNGCSPQKGDILISKDGANCLDLIFVYNQDERIVILSSIAIVRLKPSYNPFFFRYYLLSPIAQKIMRDGYVSGSAIPRVILKDFKRIPVPKPPQKVQDSIATILCSFDSKIEINQQMNATLEKIGQAVFKHWFIDFQFPNEEGKPYKSSGGKMVDSGLGEIPKGWEIKPLGEVASFLRGFSYNGTEKFSTQNGYVFITLNNVKEGGGFKPEYAWIKSERLKEHHFLKEKDLIITNTEQTKDGRLLAFPAIVYFPQDYGEKVGVFSHHITRVVPKDTNSKHFLYFFLLMTQNESVAFHTGSVIWGLDVNNFANHRHVVWAPREIMIKFEEIAETLFEKMILNQKEISRLSRIRDSLLPRLMSGKIRVNVEASS